MNKTLLAFALAAICSAPALAQQADYCNPSGYATGVTNDRDNPHQACDPRMVPRVNGVPQEQPAPTARPHYNETQPAPASGYYNGRNYDRRAYDGRNYDRRYNDPRYNDPRYSGNRDSREWERYRGEGNYYYGARGPEWRRGAHIPREYMDRQYWVSDWRAHRLAPPPRGYQWVQVGNDYVLVALATGIIAQLLLAQ
jgi:Ni/Co efflux regulator RcnB